MSSLLLIGVVTQRASLARNAIPEARAWQMVFEKERMESGLLANQVAPSDRPVLWTGHGYPAYLFDGYVVDYAGLNFRKIWAAVDLAKRPDARSVAFLREMGMDDEAIQNPKLVEQKAGWLLMMLHQPNVYMQHSLFPERVQRARRMRLAGSFYTIDLVGAPAFRVFVEDRNWKGVTLPFEERDFTLVEPLERKPGSMVMDVKTINLRVPAGATTVLFGVERSAAAKTVEVQGPDGWGRVCQVAAIENSLRMPEVQACEVALESLAPGSDVAISTPSGDRIKVFEPAYTRRD